MKSRHAKFQLGPLTDSPAESTQGLKKMVLGFRNFTKKSAKSIRNIIF